MASRDIKGFYKMQKKKNKSKSKSGSGATVGATQPQTPALLAHGAPDLRTEEYSEEEERLRQFDMDMRYGPCIGMTRLDRWKRAFAMGLNPPADVVQILSNLSSQGSNPNAHHLDCLWEGRI